MRDKNADGQRHRRAYRSIERETHRDRSRETHVQKQMCTGNTEEDTHNHSWRELHKPHRKREDQVPNRMPPTRYQDDLGAMGYCWRYDSGPSRLCLGDLALFRAY